ncbi:MAG TPA: dienelactone hydrolase family protein [Patescibacteria group bacterium]|nr:dienelactone hydrolase family protein [Patescibacteria group bacterium]
MRMMLPLALAAALLPTLAQAEVQTRTLSYDVEGTTVESVLVYDDAGAAKRPALVMVPNWMGVNASQIEKAKAIAGKDYVILVADVYGKATRPADADEAGKAAGAMYADRAALRARVNAALDQLANAKDAPVDATKLGAIGFCFGGATALELARSGADIAGVVSFHGNLATDLPAKAGEVKAKVLALNGADDTYVPVDQINGFTTEMQSAGIDFQFVNFGGAVHCFAESDANSGPGCLYNERAAKRAFRMMRDFFDEAFSAQ